MSFIKQITKKWCSKLYLLAERYQQEQQRKFFGFPPSFSFYKVSFAGNIHVGEHTYVNEFSRIDSGEKSKISIGKYCAIGRFVHITSKTHDLSQSTSDENHGIIKMAEADVNIGNYVWIGDKVTILPGVRIADYAVVAAHSVVSRNVLQFEVVVGSPARHLKFNTEHYRYKEYPQN